MSMVNGINNLNSITNVQDVNFGSESAIAPAIVNKADELSLSKQNNKGNKVLLGAMILAALVGFRGKISGFFQKNFPNFIKTVGEKFTTIKKAVSNFLKTCTPDKQQVTKVVNSAKDNLSKGVNATKEGISKGVATVKEGISKTVNVTKESISEVSEKVKTKI